jgi:hypothetical protein
VLEAAPRTGNEALRVGGRCVRRLVNPGSQFTLMATTRSENCRFVVCTTITPVGKRSISWWKPATDFVWGVVDAVYAIPDQRGV